MKSRLILGMMMIALLVLAGCGEDPCEKGWRCKDASTQAFQDGDCSWKDDTPCEFGCETGVCKAGSRTEIRAQGGRGQETEMVISPSKDNTISGIVSLTMTEVPENTGVVWFAIQGQGLPPIEETGPNLGSDSTPEDGFGLMVDTTNYGNGFYEIYAYAFTLEARGADGPPEGYAKAQVIIENGPSCPAACPEPGLWSACTPGGTKQRQNYKCSEDTDFKCESYQEMDNCKRQITMKGGNGLEVVLTPSLDLQVKGTITVEATSVPDGTSKVLFMLGTDAAIRGEQGEKAVMEIDDSIENGWKAVIDTTTFDNGVYKIYAATGYEGAPDDNPWSDSAWSQVEIDN